MQIVYELLNNGEDIYALFNELDKAYGLRYSHSGPDPLMAAQGFEFMQEEHGALKKEEDGRNLQYECFLLRFESREDCDCYLEEFRKRMGKLRGFPCVYCRTGEITATVIFNMVDHDGHLFGEFEKRRFMSLFKE
ncbi:MAG TPA: hypothetical protein DCL38_07595 [Lachnospiraceae bacterium]|nr:hypothetical protein [Lachnospiraceae bacterium]